MTETLENFQKRFTELTGVPIYHLKAGKNVAAPYAAWYIAEDRNLYADNSLYFEFGYLLVVEIYTRKDKAGLEAIGKLQKAGYYCKLRDDNWLADENQWLTICEIEVRCVD